MSKIINQIKREMQNGNLRIVFGGGREIVEIIALESGYSWRNIDGDRWHLPEALALPLITFSIECQLANETVFLEEVSLGFATKLSIESRLTAAWDSWKEYYEVTE